MKLFKLFLLLGAVCAGAALFAGCSDDKSSGPLVGTWTGPHNDRINTLVFTDDGRFSWKMGYANRRDGSGTYHHSGMMLTLFWNSGDYAGSSIVYYITALTESELVFVDSDGNVNSYRKSK